MATISEEIMDTGMIFLHGTRKSKLSETMEIGLVCAKEGQDKWRGVLLPCSNINALREYWWPSMEDATSKKVVVYSIPRELTINLEAKDFLSSQIMSLCEEKTGIVDSTLSGEYLQFIKKELEYRKNSGKRLDLSRLSDEELSSLLGLTPRLVLPSKFVLGVMDHQTKEFELNPNYIGNL